MKLVLLFYFVLFQTFLGFIASTPAECSFEDVVGIGYTCIFRNVSLEENDSLEISGLHQGNRTNDDVFGVIFRESSLERFPREVFQQFLNVQHCSARNCGIQANSNAGSTFPIARNLRFLDLSGNRVRPVPRMFEGATNLRTLDLSYNGMSMAAVDTFMDLRVLETFNLEGNFYEIVSFISFNLPNLRTLSLKNNRIANMDAFYRVQGIEYLDLSNNQITMFNSMVTQNLLNLRHLDISGNKISYLQSLSSKQQEKLRNI